jgi:hypothetical protein
MSSSSPAKDTNPTLVARRLMQQAHNRDGLPEIFAGVGLLIGSGLSWSDLLRGSTEQSIALLASTLLTIVYCLVSGRAVKWLRRRYLINRVGYVQYRANTPAMLRAILLGVVVSVTVALTMWMVRSVESLKWLIVMLGFSIGAFEVFAGRLPRFWFTGTFAVLAALALASSTLSFAVSLAVFFDLIGVVEIIVGTFVLVRLLLQPVEARE